MGRRFKSAHQLQKKSAISGVKNAVARFFIEGGIQVVSGMLTGAASYLVGAAIKGEEISFKNCMKAVLIGGLTSAIMFCGSKLLKAIGNKFAKNKDSAIPTETKTPRNDGVTNEDPLANARKIGKEGEDIASLYGKGEGRVHYTGKISGKLRISDGSVVNGKTGVLQEVKNVKYQGYTKQMKDYVAQLSQETYVNGKKVIFTNLELFVRKNGGTRLSEPLKKMIRDGYIILKEVL